MHHDNYWEKRMKEYGHTGWGDPAIYAFDQRIRLNVVAEIVDMYLKGVGNNLLDFGCGTGDFSYELSYKYKNIYLYDVSETCVENACGRLNNGIAVLDFEKLKMINVKYDTILSITVLQHIVDDNELRDRLSYMYDNLSHDGILIVEESFLGKIDSMIEQSWTSVAFEGLITELGFQVFKKYNYYYPDNSNKHFRAYVNRMDVRVLRKIYNHVSLKKKKAIQKILESIACRYNSNTKDFYYDWTNEFGTKIYVLKKTCCNIEKCI